MKNRSRPPDGGGHVFENGARCSAFSFASSSGVGSVRGTTLRFEEIAIKSSGVRSLLSIEETFSFSMTSLDDSSTFLEEFISFRRMEDLHCRIRDLFFVLFSFYSSFFTRCLERENANFSFFFCSSGRKNQSVE